MKEKEKERVKIEKFERRKEENTHLLDILSVYLYMILCPIFVYQLILSSAIGIVSVRIQQHLYSCLIRSRCRQA